MNSSPALERALEDLIPKSLDDIVRKNRQSCSIHLTADEDLAALTRSIIADESDIKDEIDDWRVVCYHRTPELGGKAHLLIGHAIRANCNWGTSPISAIDLLVGLATTRSGSIYRLRGPRGKGEPPTDHLICLCALLHTWGSGPVVGVPYFFF